MYKKRRRKNCSSLSVISESAQMSFIGPVSGAAIRGVNAFPLHPSFLHRGIGKAYLYCKSVSPPRHAHNVPIRLLKGGVFEFFHLGHTLEGRRLQPPWSAAAAWAWTSLFLLWCTCVTLGAARRVCQAYITSPFCASQST